MAEPGCAVQPGWLDHNHGPQPRHRPTATRVDARRPPPRSSPTRLRFGCGSVCGPVCGALQSRGMDIFRIFDREVVRASAFCSPKSWTRDPRLVGHASASAMAATARAVGVDSDAVVDALLSVSDHTELADCIVVAAMVGLVRSRCRRSLIPPEELLAEFTISVAETRRDGRRTVSEGVVSVGHCETRLPREAAPVASAPAGRLYFLDRPQITL